MEWGREEEKDRIRGTENVVVEHRTGIKMKATKKRGRIVSFPADIGGKLGAKVSCLKFLPNTQADKPNRSS
jgi:N-acetyltransferase